MAIGRAGPRTIGSGGTGVIVAQYYAASRAAAMAKMAHFRYHERHLSCARTPPKGAASECDTAAVALGSNQFHGGGLRGVLRVEWHPRQAL